MRENDKPLLDNDCLIVRLDIDEKSKSNEDNNHRHFYKYIVAIIAIICILVQLGETVSVFKTKKTYRLIYWYCKSINMAIPCIIFTTSIIRQRADWKSSKLDNGTMQSHTTNIILLFMAGLYFATLASLIFFEDNVLRQSIFNFGYVTGLFMVAAHFIGTLSWGKITKYDTFDTLSINWWTCIYLIVTFFNFMAVTVIQPWYQYHHFLQLNNDMEDITGEFVHVMIMYCCRPALTIVAFRCIEQIMHQLGHKHHGRSAHGHDSNVHVSINSDDIQNEPKCITFHHITTTELIVLAPFVFFVVVFDLMTLSNPNTDTSSRVDFLIWSLVFIIQIIWTLYVIYIINKYRTNIINIKRVFQKHVALFISATGLIIALNGTIGVYHYIWEVWFVYIFDIIYVILQCCVLVLVKESKLNSNDFDNMSWKVKTYGKIIVILHITLIIHAFLGEGYHLEETMDDSIEHDVGDTFGALEFIFFFWSIEFHLASIERIQFTSK